jgi:hypothetical protein
MSSSPPQPTQSTKRPLEEASSPSRATDQPDAKRPALDKILKNDGEVKNTKALEDAVESADKHGDEASNGVKSETETTTVEVSADDKVAAAAGAASSSAAAHDETSWIHIRAVISSPEAATIIGKGGENVSNIRKMSNAKCTVSDYQKGAVERILTVSGIVDAVAKVGSHSSMLCFHHANLSLGFWPDHSYIEQRGSDGDLDRLIKDVPAASAYSPHSHWLYHWKGWCSHQGNPGSVGGSA